MNRAILFLPIAGVKILVTKAAVLAFLLLSAAIKGKALHRDDAQWRRYLLHLKERGIARFFLALYLPAALLSALISYALFVRAGFKRPLPLTVSLTASCAAFSWLEYQRKGRRAIADGLRKIRAAARRESGKD